MTPNNSPSLRVAFLGTRGFPNVQGGVERHCQELATRLAALGCSVTVYTRKPYVDPSLAQYENVQLTALWAPRKKSLEAIMHTLWALCVARFQRPRFDLVHIHAIGPSLVTPLARLLGFKVIVTNHGPDYDRQKWGLFAKAALRLGEFLGTWSAHNVIGISKVICDRLERDYRRSVRLVPNGVNPPAASIPDDYLGELGLTRKRYILAVARLVPEKGLHDLIAAFRLAKHPWKLVIAGGSDHEDEYSQRLRSMASQSPEIIMTGPLEMSRLSQLYANAGLFVLPSYHEGLPIVLLEALSYNLNVLCSSIPANLEVIKEQQFLFTPGNIDQLSKKLLQAISYTEPQWKNNLQAYDWDKIAQQVLNIYTETVRT